MNVRRLPVIAAVLSAGCYSETIGPYVTEVVASKDRSHYVVTRCLISLDHGLFGGTSVSKGDCTKDELPPLQAAGSGTSAATGTTSKKP